MSCDKGFKEALYYAERKCKNVQQDDGNLCRTYI